MQGLTGQTVASVVDKVLSVLRVKREHFVIVLFPLVYGFKLVSQIVLLHLWCKQQIKIILSYLKGYLTCFSHGAPSNYLDLHATAKHLLNHITWQLFATSIIAFVLVEIFMITYVKPIQSRVSSFTSVSLWPLCNKKLHDLSTDGITHEPWMFERLMCTRSGFGFVCLTEWYESSMYAFILHNAWFSTNGHSDLEECS